ncbi:MAG: ADP-ribosyl-[dinitrogen reductase] hydrolase [Myxococcota bacterium]|jgi:ADP-ribosyl-[dinitrogen reductase] hydrolase
MPMIRKITTSHPIITVDNRDQLQQLLRDGTLQLADAPWLSSQPSAPDTSQDRVEGMLLGVAIGDALGRPSEGMIPARRQRTHGQIRSYHRHHRAKHHSGAVWGEPSDDTQLTFWALDQLIEDSGLDPERLSNRFAREGGKLIGIGGTVREFRVRAARGLPWTERGVDSAGNGALMRAAPMLMPHLHTPTPALWADAALGAFLTHNDSASTASCLAFTDMLWQLLSMSSPPPASWWVETFLDRATPLEVRDDYAPRSGEGSFTGTLCARIREQLSGLADDPRETVDICDGLYSGAYMLETVPCVLTILSRHGHDPEEAIVRAVNDTKDNDTVAAIVGAAVGALHGRAALPDRWLSGLSGRLSKRGRPGEVFEILDRACATFGPSK